MIELACPSCGRGGSIPRDKLNTRLVCKKCHKVFHMNAAGRTVLGEPQDEAARSDSQGATRDRMRLPDFEGVSLKETLPAVSGRSVLIGVGSLVLLSGIWYFLSLPPQGLEGITKVTAERFAEDDLAYLKQLASSDTVDDVVRWFDLVHPRLVKSREEWKTGASEVRVMVIDENRRQRSGQAEAFVYPKHGPVHTASIANAASAATAAEPVVTQPVDLMLYWVLDGQGRWRIDGRRTFQEAGSPQ